jgi:hypothetical protein
MEVLFVKENFVDPYIVTIDSTLLKAKGHLWHKLSMIKGGYCLNVKTVSPLSVRSAFGENTTTAAGNPIPIYRIFNEPNVISPPAESPSITILLRE